MSSPILLSHPISETLATQPSSLVRRAAAPGHTAQPFQPTRTAKEFLEESWSRNIIERTRNAVAAIATEYAQQRGRSTIGNANEAAAQLNDRDLVFIDPPYSGVHYSRFYHVLETISRGECGEVSGVGRYPATVLRPKSRYSLKTESNHALDELFSIVALRGAKAILTFPDHECSNGLSGELVREFAQKYFRVKERSVASVFSTLGGTKDLAHENSGRAARHHARELMLVLRPR